jgi:hypothetical protein
MLVGPQLERCAGIRSALRPRAAPAHGLGVPRSQQCDLPRPAALLLVYARSRCEMYGPGSHARRSGDMEAGRLQSREGSVLRCDWTLARGRAHPSVLPGCTLLWVSAATLSSLTVLQARRASRFRGKSDQNRDLYCRPLLVQPRDKCFLQHQLVCLLVQCLHALFEHLDDVIPKVGLHQVADLARL